MTAPANPFAQNPFAQNPASVSEAPASASAAPDPWTATSTFNPLPPSPPSSPGADPFGAPAPQSDRARVRDCAGRLLLIMPKKVETVRNSLDRKNPDATQDRMTADIVILDGGPILYGGNPEARQNPKAHDRTHDVPWKMTGSYVSNVGLVSQCRDALHEHLRAKSGQPPKGPTMVLGRLYQGPAGENPEGPWLLAAPSDEDKALARSWLAANPRDPFAG